MKCPQPRGMSCGRTPRVECGRLSVLAGLLPLCPGKPQNRSVNFGGDRWGCAGLLLTRVNHYHRPARWPHVTKLPSAPAALVRCRSLPLSPSGSTLLTQRSPISSACTPGRLFSTRVLRKAPRKSFAMNETAIFSRHAFRRLDHLLTLHHNCAIPRFLARVLHLEGRKTAAAENPAATQYGGTHTSPVRVPSAIAARV